MQIQRKRKFISILIQQRVFIAHSDSIVVWPNFVPSHNNVFICNVLLIKFTFFFFLFVCTTHRWQSRRKRITNLHSPIKKESKRTIQNVGLSFLCLGDLVFVVLSPSLQQLQTMCLYNSSTISFFSLHFSFLFSLPEFQRL